MTALQKHRHRLNKKKNLNLKVTPTEDQKVQAETT